MFKEVELEWTVKVQPDAMRSSAHIQRALILELLKDFNDLKCTEEHGYYVTLTTLENISGGKLWERRGCAAFQVRFRCVVFNLDKLEHMYAVVTNVSDAGVMCQCGPVENLFITKSHVEEYNFVQDPQSWVRSMDGATIKEGTVVLVKILAAQWEPATRDWSAVGSLNGNSVGVARWKEVPKSGSHDQAGAATDGGLWGEPIADTGAADGAWGAPAMEDADDAGWG